MTAGPPGDRSGAAEARLDQVAGRRCLLVVGLLVPLMGLLAVVQARVPVVQREPPMALGTIDPDTAPWWELTALPRFGPALAFEVVRFRESVRASAAASSDGRVFRVAADLAEVRGIGPKTVERIGPYLRFSSR